MFQSKEDIQNYCNKNGYCIILEKHKRKLVKKTADNGYMVYGDVTTNKGTTDNALEHFVKQLYNNLVNPSMQFTDIVECIQIINLDIFHQYDKRQMEIQEHKTIIDDLDNSKFKLFGKSNNLVYGQKYMINNNTGKYDYFTAYFNIIDNELVYIDERQLSDKDKKKAIKFSNLENVQNALKDDLANEHSEKYNEECRKWDLIK